MDQQTGSGVRRSAVMLFVAAASAGVVSTLLGWGRVSDGPLTLMIGHASLGVTLAVLMAMCAVLAARTGAPRWVWLAAGLGCVAVGAFACLVAAGVAMRASGAAVRSND